MPTFDSIAFSRDLIGRLVAISDNSDSVVPIQTPQALLSRPPNSIRLLRKLGNGAQEVDAIDPTATNQVRREVAHALLKQTTTGRRHAILKTALQRHREDEENDDPINQLVSATPAKRFPGTITSLEWIQYQELAGKNYNHQSQTPIYLSTGSTALDELLAIPSEISSSLSSTMKTLMPSLLPAQGLPWGHVIQCSGPSASGKTQLSLQVAFSAASQGCHVWYGASALGQGALKHLSLRLKHLAFAAMSDENRAKALALLDNISLQVLHDGYQLLVCLDHLEELLLQEREQQTFRNTKPKSHQCPRILILDAASGCLNTEDESILQTVALRLKQLARRYQLVVWINNASMTPVVKNNNTNPKPKPALGVAWKRAYDIHLSLQNQSKKDISVVASNNNENSSTNLPHQGQEALMPKAQLVRATLEQHPFQNCNVKPTLAVDFCITTRGIQDYQPVSAPI